MAVLKRYLKPKFIIPAILILVAVSLFASAGFLPVVNVGGKTTSYADFIKIVNAIETYESVAGQAIGSSEELRKLAFMNIVEQGFLDLIIERVDISFQTEAKKLVEDAIAQTPDLELDDAARTIYALSAVDFKRLILLPQAKRQLLLGRFAGSEAQLEGMWEELYANANVRIFYPGYEWENGQVVIK